VGRPQGATSGPRSASTVWYSCARRRRATALFALVVAVFAGAAVFVLLSCSDRESRGRDLRSAILRLVDDLMPRVLPPMKPACSSSGVACASMSRRGPRPVRAMRARARSLLSPGTPARLKRGASCDTRRGHERAMLVSRMSSTARRATRIVDDPHGRGAGAAEASNFAGRNGTGAPPQPPRSWRNVRHR
jgi:hypothetical protein